MILGYSQADESFSCESDSSIVSTLSDITLNNSENNSNSKNYDDLIQFVRSKDKIANKIKNGSNKSVSKLFNQSKISKKFSESSPDYSKIDKFLSHDTLSQFFSEKKSFSNLTDLDISDGSLSNKMRKPKSKKRSSSVGSMKSLINSLTCNDDSKVDFVLNNLKNDVFKSPIRNLYLDTSQDFKDSLQISENLQSLQFNQEVNEKLQKLENAEEANGILTTQENQAKPRLKSIEEYPEVKENGSSGSSSHSNNKQLLNNSKRLDGENNQAESSELKNSVDNEKSIQNTSNSTDELFAHLNKKIDDLNNTNMTGTSFANNNMTNVEGGGYYFFNNVMDPNFAHIHQQYYNFQNVSNFNQQRGREIFNENSHYSNPGNNPSKTNTNNLIYKNLPATNTINKNSLSSQGYTNNQNFNNLNNYRPNQLPYYNNNLMPQSQTPLYTNPSLLQRNINLPYNNFNNNLLQMNNIKTPINNQIPYGKNINQNFILPVNINNQPYGKNVGKFLSPNYADLSDEEIAKLAGLICKDQSGCRLIQKRIIDNPHFAEEILFYELQNCMLDLINDAFGNYLIQKLIECISEEQIEWIINLIEPCFVEISCSSHGTRVVQKLIDVLYTQNLFDLFNSILAKNILPLAKDNNANHILQKYVYTIKAPNNQFVYDIVLQNFVEISKDKHGCCVVQKVIDAGDTQQKKALIDISLKLAMSFISDQYANYVIQFIITLNNYKVNRQIAEIFTYNLRYLCKQKFSSNVIEKCFDHSDEETQLFLINEILRDESLISELIADNFGNYVIQKALALSKGENYKKLLTCIGKNLDKLKSVQFGNKLLTKFLNNYKELPSLINNPGLIEVNHRETTKASLNKRVTPVINNQDFLNNLKISGAQNLKNNNQKFSKKQTNDNFVNGYVIKNDEHFGKTNYNTMNYVHQNYMNQNFNNMQPQNNHHQIIGNNIHSLERGKPDYNLNFNMNFNYVPVPNNIPNLGNNNPTKYNNKRDRNKNVYQNNMYQ